MRTGNPDLLKSEAKKCGSHYFDKSTMRFFASRLSPQLHPSEKGEDATYFVTSEKFESQRLGDGPRRYSVHRFKNCRIDTVGAFQRFRTGGAAHTAATRLARGVDSDGLSGFLPASGAGKLVLFGGLGLAAGAAALYFIRRGATVDMTPRRVPTPAASVPTAPASRVTPRAFQKDLSTLMNYAARFGINRPQDQLTPATEADVRKVMVAIANENGMPKTAAMAAIAKPGFVGWPADELWPGTPFSVYYYVTQHIAGATGKPFDTTIMPDTPGTVPGSSRPIHGAPVGIYDDPSVFAAPAMAFEPAYEVMH